MGEESLSLVFLWSDPVTAALVQSMCVHVNKQGAYYATDRGSRGSAQIKPNSTKARACSRWAAQ